MVSLMRTIPFSFVVLFLLALISCSGNPEKRANQLARKALDAQFRGEMETAAGYFEQAIEICPEYVEARVGLGQVYNYLQRQPEARKCYESAIEGYKKRLEAKPDDVNTLTNLGGVCAVLGKMGSAREYLQKALDRDARNKNASYLLANLKEFATAWNQVPPPHRDEQKIQHTILAPLE